MESMLIAVPMEDLRISLEHTFSPSYQVTVCADGPLALDLLTHNTYDVLLLSLDMPRLDGLTILHRAKPHIPPAILVFSLVYSSYAFQQAIDLGVSHILMLPCAADTVQRHISRIRDHLNSQERKLTPQELAACHLQRLGFPNQRSAFRLLSILISLFAQDSEQSLTKELYPAAAKLYGSSSSQVAKSAERFIKEIWETRQADLWDQYFPQKDPANPHCPTNRQFISTLAAYLSQEQNSLP